MCAFLWQSKVHPVHSLIGAVSCEGRWAATLGIVLAVSRAFIAEVGMAFEPELALLEVVAHTHWLPRHWRGRAHTQEVQQQFQELFQFKVGPPLSHWHLPLL